MSKEHAYAYEAGYRDGSVHYELEHCPACKNVADLQEALSENAKLRELVKYTLLCCERGWPCEECPLCGERGTSTDVDGREVTYTICKARDTAQDLGIEVDG